MKPIHLPLEKWEKITESPLQLIKYTLPEETEWTGRVFNKADIMGSEPDNNYHVPDSKEYDYYINTSSNIVTMVAKGALSPQSDFDLYQKLK